MFYLYGKHQKTKEEDEKRKKKGQHTQIPGTNNKKYIYNKKNNDTGAHNLVNKYNLTTNTSVAANCSCLLSGSCVILFCLASFDVVAVDVRVFFFFSSKLYQ